MLAADAVIVTVSAAVLQARHTALFSPGLPPPADTCTSGGTPPPEALPEWVRGLHSIRFGPPGPEWIQAGSSPGGSGGGGPGSSVGAVMWVTGAAALQAEAQTDQEVVAGVQQLLSTFPGVPLPPGLDPSQPPALLRSRWGCDPLFLGSYSYIRAGQGAVDGSTGPDELAQPLMAGGALRLLFAGEATNRQFMGTTHGAWLSGQREAERIAGHVAQQLQQKKKTCPEGA
ncbi:flavin-containing amine oxidoreductase-domain containing protein [Haematococcus lacustris]